jgi:hypothetical protein
MSSTNNFTNFKALGKKFAKKIADEEAMATNFIETLQGSIMTLTSSI